MKEVLFFSDLKGGRRENSHQVHLCASETEKGVLASETASLPPSEESPPFKKSVSQISSLSPLMELANANPLFPMFVLS